MCLHVNIAIEVIHYRFVLNNCMSSVTISYFIINCSVIVLAFCTNLSLNYQLGHRACFAGLYVLREQQDGKQDDSGAKHRQPRAVRSASQTRLDGSAAVEGTITGRERQEAG